MSLLYSKQVAYKCSMCGKQHEVPRLAIMCFYHDLEAKYAEDIEFMLYEGVVCGYGYGSTPNYIYSEKVYKNSKIDNIINFAIENNLRECKIYVIIKDKLNYFDCYLEDIIEQEEEYL